MTRQPAFHTPRGIIRCASCRTDDYGFPPVDGPMHEGHVALRFNNVVPGTVKVFLDGDDVTSRCVEAVAGKFGMVYLYDLDSSGNRYVCPAPGIPGHAVVVQKLGRVRVEQAPRTRPASP